MLVENFMKIAIPEIFGHKKTAFRRYANEPIEPIESIEIVMRSWV